MLLKSGTWWAKRWNEIILPAIQKGIIKVVKATPKHSRRAFQLFYGILEEEGRQYRVTAWGFPNNEPHVHVEIEGSKAKS